MHRLQAWAWILFAWTIVLIPRTTFAQIEHIPDLGLWLKADAITDVRDGQPVNLWPDSSGNGWDAKTYDPYKGYFIYGEDVANGEPAVIALGQGAFQVSGKSELVKGSRDYTIIAVASDDGNQELNHIFGFNDGYYDHQWYLRNRGGDQHMRLIQGSALGSMSTARPIAPGDKGFRVYAWMREGENWPSFYDGDSSGTVVGGDREFNLYEPDPTTSLPAYQIAGYGPALMDEGPDCWFTGEIAELIIFTRALKPVEHNLVGSYLARKYSLKTAYVDLGTSPDEERDQPGSAPEDWLKNWPRYFPAYWWSGASALRANSDGQEIKTWQDSLNPGNDIDITDPYGESNTLWRYPRGYVVGDHQGPSGNAICQARLLAGMPGVRLAGGDQEQMTQLYLDGVSELVGDFSATLFFIARIYQPLQETPVHPVSAGWLNSPESGWAIELDPAVDGMAIWLGGKRRLVAPTGSAPWAGENGESIAIVSLSKTAGSWNSTTTLKVNGKILQLRGSKETDIVPDVLQGYLRIGSAPGQGPVGPAMDIGDVILFRDVLPAEVENAVGYQLATKYDLQTAYVPPSQFHQPAGPPDRVESLSTSTGGNTTGSSVQVSPERFQFELRDCPGNKVPLILKSSDGQPFRVLGYTSWTNSYVNENWAVQLQFDPGQSTVEHRLRLDLDLDQLQSAALKGAQTALCLRLDHPRVKKVRVPFETQLPFIMEPRAAFLGTLHPGKSKDLTVRVTSNYGESFAFENLYCMHGLLRILAKESIQDGYLIRLQAIAPPPERAARYVQRDEKMIAKDYLLVKIRDHPFGNLSVHCYWLVDAPASLSLLGK